MEGRYGYADVIHVRQIEICAVKLISVDAENGAWNLDVQEFMKFRQDYCIIF